MSSVSIEDKNIYIKRKVWGRNGDDVWLTTNNNPCSNPSKQADYITDGDRQGDEFYYKTDNGKLYTYGESFTNPENSFPVEVISEGYEYNPKNPKYDKVKEEGYKSINMKINISCFSDIF